MNHKQVATDVINAVGRENLVAAAHCATRLRLVLKDDEKINQAALDANDGVRGPLKPMANTKLLLALVMSTTFTMN